MKVLGKVLSYSTACAILFSTAAPLCSVNARADSSEKEEVIYVMCDADGSVNEVYAVNIFGEGNITDYGKYTSPKLLNTEGKITQKGDKVTFRSDAPKAYMQGTLENAQIPWIISIKYYLDGKEIEPEKIGGKSGDLEIRFSTKENKECKGNFFKSYALQASFSLDTKFCTDITASGATAANAGSKKQLSYTILPGKETDYSIKAKVVNFEMPSVAINGVKINMDLDIDKSKVTDETKKLTDNVKKLDDGASELSDGAKKLKDGGKSVKSGTSSLSGGADKLNSSLRQLEEGIISVQSGLNKLDSQSGSLNGGSASVKEALETIRVSLAGVSADTDKLSQLVSSSGAIRSSLALMNDSVHQLSAASSFDTYKLTMKINGLDVDAVIASNDQTSELIKKNLAELESKKAAAAAVGLDLTMYEQQKELLMQLLQSNEANKAVISSAKSYYDTISANLSELDSSMAKLSDSYSQFNEGIKQFVNSLSTMIVDLSKLSDGINKLADSYSDLDNGINQYTSGVSQINAGFGTLKSGVSALADGSKTLCEGAGSLDDGVSQLYSGISELCDGTDMLSKGTGEFRKETAGIDDEIFDKIDDLLSDITGSDSETESFVSEKNENVTSVQFVIKTDAVEIPKTEPVKAEKKEKKSFWKKITDLFKK